MYKSCDIISAVRTETNNPDMPVVDIIRESTRTKRQFPGLSMCDHVSMICSGMKKQKDEHIDLKHLKSLFPHMDKTILRDTLSDHGSMDAAATYLISKGALDRTLHKIVRLSRNTETLRWFETYFANLFSFMPMDVIRTAVRENEDMIKVYCLLSSLPYSTLHGRRHALPLSYDDEKWSSCFDIARKIASIHQKSLRKKASINWALQCNDVVTCSVCYETCPRPITAFCHRDENHIICDSCLTKYISTELFDSGKATTKCVLCPDGKYAIAKLQDILPEKTMTVFTCLEAKAALLAAGITETMHTCKCGNSVILADDATIHKCVECGHATCVLCNEESHLPLRCDQVEHFTAARKKMEEAMTAALVRKCECGLIFLKESGCNKMTCKCGRKMCYLCKQPITGYDHFYDNSPCKLFEEADSIDKARVTEAERETRVEF